MKSDPGFCEREGSEKIAEEVMLKPNAKEEVLGSWGEGTALRGQRSGCTSS